MRPRILSVAFLIWSASCLAQTTLPAPPGATTAATRSIFEYERSPYLCVSGGAEIYVGRVTSKGPVILQQDPVESGLLKFTIDRSLRGSAASPMTLPYSFTHSVGLYHGSMVSQTWPDVDDLVKDGSLLLIVVIPGADDPIAKVTPGCPGAASNVYVVSGQDDPIVKAYQGFIAICSLQGQKAAEAIATEAGAGTPLERAFAEDAAAAALGPEDAVKVIGAAVEAGEKVEKPNEDTEDIRHGTDLLLDFGLSPGSRPVAGRLPAKRMMVHVVISSPNPNFNHWPVLSLARFIEGGAKVTDVVPTAADQAALADAVRTTSKGADPTTQAACTSVLKWLGVGN
jgi:hypothetical protein